MRKITSIYVEPLLIRTYQYLKKRLDPPLAFKRKVDSSRPIFFCWMILHLRPQLSSFPSKKLTFPNFMVNFYKERFTRYDFVACDKLYDRPTTRIVSCKSNLQLAYDCRVHVSKNVVDNRRYIERWKECSLEMSDTSKCFRIGFA